MIRIALVALLLLAAVPSGARAQIFDDEDRGPGGTVPRYDPAGEALRSLVVPGWSQMRQGQDVRGTAHLMLAMVSLVFALGVAEVPLIGDPDDNFGQVVAGAFYGLNAVVSAYDAHRTAVESNREHGWDLPEAAAARPVGLRLTLLRRSF